MPIVSSKLGRVGWANARDAACTNEWSPESRCCRVVEVHRETLVVADGGTRETVRLHPACRHALDADRRAVAVGDWVGVRDQWVTHVAVPRSQLARLDGSGVRHTIVSNVDVAFIVMGLDGDFNLRRLERFLAIIRVASSNCETGEIMPVIALTKDDVVFDGAAKADQIAERIASDIPIHVVDARSERAGEMLRAYVPAGTTAVLIGSSGAGKSTLTNAILCASIQDTGAVRASDDRGQHTTTARSLHLILDGGCIIDTPGVRTLAPDADAAAVASAFEDITNHALKCRFRNCTHTVEPGCAVRSNVQEDRVKNFQKLVRDAKRDSMTPLERKAQQNVWKARAKEVRNSRKREQ